MPIIELKNYKVSKRLLEVFFVFQLYSCIGQAPSISNYMMNSNIALNGTQISGSIFKDQSIGEDTYKGELPMHSSIGVYVDGDIPLAMEVGTSGIVPLLGYKTEYFGGVGWLNVNRDLWTGGIGISEFYKGKYGMLGLIQYVSRNTISKYYQEVGSMDVTYFDGDKYNEVGLGVYGGFMLMKIWGLSAEYRCGNEAGTKLLRHYVSLSINWNLPNARINIKKVNQSR